MQNLDIKIKYKTYSEDIVNDFYIPVLSNSIKYYRAVGYFSSNILLNYIRGLINFIRNGGEIRLIISPYLSEEDFNELQKMSTQESAVDRITNDFDDFLSADRKTIAASKLFVLLIQNNILKVKVAEPKNIFGLFHEKIGIFIDSDDNKIAIIGSNNETGNATRYNQESFNTFCSWKDGQVEYVEQHYKDFIHLWDGDIADVNIISIDKAIKDKILKKHNINETIDELIGIILEEEPLSYSLGFKPYPHQQIAVDKWLEVKQGIFKFATGSGKTKTAILLMEELKRISQKQLFMIVVPDKTLVNQWYDELIKYSNNIIKCFSDSNWIESFIDLSYRYKDLSNIYQYVITTNDTFYGENFQRPLARFDNDYLLVVDECHTWGTERILNALPSPDMRLGLSATPELFFSKDKTSKLLSFFGGIIHEYSLEDAIKDKKLVGYKYYPILVNLTQDEIEEYDNLTKKIVKMIGTDAEDFSDKYSKALEMMLFKRARIIYGAKNKLVKLNSMIDSIEKKGKLLIYCGPTSYTSSFDTEVDIESVTQLQTVNKILANNGKQFAQYTSKEKEFERKIAIDLFKKQTYSTLVAIKCLDEGIDIPEIERAIILASSTNPREFIQRRGRIIRPFPGKKFAEIYDFIVYEKQYDSLVKKELERFYEFARISLNLEELKIEHKELFELHDKIGGKQND